VLVVAVILDQYARESAQRGSARKTQKTAMAGVKQPSGETPHV
jgi:hypothetical protein